MNSFMKTINIDSHKIEANDSLITGNSNIIFGNNNKINGDYNKIYGNNNVVAGNGNVAKGEYNSASGGSNEVRDPFGNAYSITASSSSPLSPSSQFFAPIDIPRTPSSVVNNSNTTYFQPVASNQYPPASPRGTAFEYPPVSPRSAVYDSTPLPYQPPASPVSFSLPFSSGGANSYFQPVPMVPPRAAVSPAPSAYLVVTPSPVPYNNPFSPPSSPTPFANPIEAQQQKEVKDTKEKDKDLIQDGTLVFIINEAESEYVREFCQILSANSGQRVGCHLSCGRMCIVGLGELDRIRDTLINLLPMLNLKLKEWSWNTFGKNVCNDKEVYFKRLFKEYTKEDVDCWRNKPTKIAA